MKKTVGYLKAYASEVDKKTFFISFIFITLAIFINYQYGIEKKIRSLPEMQQYLSWFSIFFTAFSFPHLLQRLLHAGKVIANERFLILLIIAPAIFAWKMSGNVHFDFSADEPTNTYWNHVVYWPFKLLVVTMALFVVWKIYDRTQPFYGLNTSKLELKPYIIMLLLMIPLVAAASTQPDFLALYPKLKNVELLTNKSNAWYKLLYELSYGSDFFTIELFFRGFLIMAYAKWAGKDVILPMALFYCTIHFGKPIGECISSFFGGIILGVITYNTQSIYGGLIVHLGIAWLMEIGGYLGN